MGQSVYPVATSGASITPFDAAFTYNFSTDTKGHQVLLDLTQTIPSGTYTISGYANGYKMPYKIELLDSSNTVVGTATTTYSLGSSSNNSSTYNCTVTTTNAFAKIRFIGNALGNEVNFASSAPATGSHVRIEAGTRTTSDKTFLDYFYNASGSTTWDNSFPSSMPAGYYYIVHWYFNNKLYFMLQSLEPSVAPNGSTTNNIIIRPWDLATSTWGTASNTINPSAIGFQTWANCYSGSSYFFPVIFKNGNVAIKATYYMNTSGATTLTTTDRYFTYSTSTNTVAGGSANLPDKAYLVRSSASMYYNPTNDEWYHQGSWNNSNGYLNGIIKMSNNFTVSSGNSSAEVRNQNFLTVQNAANPKIISYSKVGNSTDWRATIYASFDGSYSQGLTYDSSINSYGSYPFIGSVNCQGVGTQVNGVDTHIVIRQDTNNTPIYIGRPTFANTSSTSFNTIVETNNWAVQWLNDVANDFPGSSNYVTIQPINSTQYGLVFMRGALSHDSLFSSSYRVRVVPLPITVTIPGY